MQLPVIDLSAPTGPDQLQSRLRRLRASATGEGEAGATVAQVIQDVRDRGDDAVVDYMRRWTDPAFEAHRIRVEPAELRAARDQLDPALRAALERAIEHVRGYQAHIRPRDPAPITLGGATLGLRHTPFDSAGLAVPGGRAAYPSTVIMLAGPAQAAGVASLSVVTPPPTRREGQPPADVAPLVLATCDLMGIDRVYRIGGAQAIAALALGTARVERVDFIAGPGNTYTQLAKQRLQGHVGIDGFYGPSEIVTLIDRDADPRRVASDLIAQAEHDPGHCFLVAWEPGPIDAVNRELQAQTPRRDRRAAIEASLRDSSFAVLAPDPDHAARVVDAFAAEHVNLAVKDPVHWMGRLRHAGEYFLGDATPVAAGDYYAGPSHCLPTGTTARFASGVAVHTFLKRSGWVHYPSGLPQQAIRDIAALARAEGLDGHAASVETRAAT